MAHMCTACNFMPMDGLVWFLERDSSHRGTGRKSSGSSIQCAFCGGQSKAKDMSCVVSMQYGNRLDSCLVFRAVSPPQGHCKNFLEAVNMASNAQRPGGKVGALESLSSETMSRPAKVWYEWYRVAEK